MRILCGNHIKNVMLGVTMYADTHNNKIPYTVANWPWDCQKSIVTELLKNMGTDTSGFPNASKDDITNTATTGGVPVEFAINFYCPANARKKRYRDREWDSPWPSYRVLGYAFMWKSSPYNGDGTMSILHRVNGVDVPDPSKKWVDRTDMPQASEAELIVDATLSDHGAIPLINYPNGNFGVIITGGSATLGVPDNSNHLITDAKVPGGNIGFADGHVEWRPFTEMMHRITRGDSTSSSISSGGPVWWWW
jgi:prepilin-type processing-associated H-X9-DG protein